MIRLLPLWILCACASLTAQVQVSVWYAPADVVVSPRFTWPPPRDAAGIDAHILAQRRAYAEAFTRRCVEPFCARVRALGARVDHASPLAPAAVVSGSPEAIALMKALPEVRTLAPSLTYEPQQDSSRRTVRADAVARLSSLPGPVTGKGVKVCVLEAQTVQQANPYTVKGVIYYQAPPAVPYGKHPTAVAGIIAGQHPQYPGQAPGVTLLNANAGSFTEANILAATDWAVKQGANTINASFGMNTSGAPALMDRYFDHVVRNLNVNFIKGAGNNGTRVGYVVSPGLGYNSITVGNSRDQKTPHWWDDDVNPSSGYLDPTTGHPKPEIVAPGTNLTGNLHTSPWIGSIGSGGSYAGPQGNAAAALLMERDPQLKLWPEAVRAVLLATAWHKIEQPLVGDHDGCGQLHALAADAVVRDGKNRLRHGNLTLKSFDARGIWTSRFRSRPGARSGPWCPGPRIRPRRIPTPMTPWRWTWISRSWTRHKSPWPRPRTGSAPSRSCASCPRPRAPTPSGSRRSGSTAPRSPTAWP